MELGLIHILYAVGFYVALLLYSTCVNVVCGHRSFWRNSLKLKTFIDGLGASFALEIVDAIIIASRDSLYSALGLSSFKVARRGPNIFSTEVSDTEQVTYEDYVGASGSTVDDSNKKHEFTEMPAAYSTQKCFLTCLSDDLLLEIGSYLDVSDVACMSSACRSINSCYTSPLMRYIIIKTHFDVNVLDKNGAFNLTSQFDWNEIYAIFASYPKLLCAELPGVHVIIDGAVFNLTKFVDSHPGGDGLLYEFNGEDASRVYHLAMHSQEAEQMKAKFLVWSPPKRALSNVLKAYKRLNNKDASKPDASVGLAIDAFISETLTPLKSLVRKLI